MPRAARFKIAAIADLLRQLEYAPPEARRRQMDAAESLVGDLDPRQAYPQDYVTYRITGYRSDRIEEPMNFVGQALMADLAGLVHQLSQSLDLRADDAARPGLSLEEARERLQVSEKTLQRYRAQGLVCHAMRFPNGAKRIGCFEDALTRFQARHQGRLSRAAGFSRIEPDEQSRIIEQARAMREADRCTLNEAAMRLAQEHGRAHETIRLLLRRHDRKASSPIFTEAGPLTERLQQVIHRAWRRGVDPAAIARRYGKSKPTIHRAVNRVRRNHLRSVTLGFVRLPTFDLPDAASVILSSPYVTSELLPRTADDALAAIEAMRREPSAVEDAEDAMLAAYNLLKSRAADRIARLGDWPGSEELDEIETDLRWILRLERRLMEMALATALRRVEQNIGRPIASLPADQIASWMRLAGEVVGAAVETIDPSRGQRFERVTGLAMDKAIARRKGDDGAKPARSDSSDRPPVRAGAKHAAGMIRLDALGRRHSWASWLELRPDIAQGIDRLPEPLRAALIMRHGLDGAPPRMCGEIAAKLGLTPISVAKLLQRAPRLMRGETIESE